MIITASSEQHILHGRESAPLSAGCLKPNALSKLKNTKEPFLFQQISPINTLEFNKWSSESLQIVDIIYNIYEELFNFNLDGNGRDIVFSNWVTYLVFHFKSMNFEYQYLKSKDPSMEAASPTNKVIKTPKSIKELRVMLQDNSFNEVLLSCFISNDEPTFYQIKDLIQNSANLNYEKSYKSILKSCIKKFHLFYSKYSRRVTPDNFLTSLFRDNIELIPDLDDFDFIYSCVDLEQRSKLFLLLSNKFKDENIDSFNKLALFLSCYIPVTMFEDIAEIQKLAKSVNFKPNTYFYSKTLHYNNELFKLKLAEEIECNQMKLVISCHGGAYHLPMWSDRDWEKRIATYMIPFSTTHNDLKNFEANKAISRSLLINKNNNDSRLSITFDDVLIIGTTFEIYRTGVVPFPDQWQMCEKYANSILETIADLKKIYKNVYFRPHFNDYGWSLSEYLTSNDSDINIIDPRKESLERNLKKFKSVINTADTTAVIKCFHKDILNMGLIDPQIYFDNNVPEIIKGLYDNKVYFREPLHLIEFLKDISNNQLTAQNIIDRNQAIDNYLKYQQEQQIKNVIYE